MNNGNKLLHEDMTFLFITWIELSEHGQIHHFHDENTIHRYCREIGDCQLRGSKYKYHKLPYAWDKHINLDSPGWLHQDSIHYIRDLGNCRLVHCALMLTKSSTVR